MRYVRYMLMLVFIVSVVALLVPSTSAAEFATPEMQRTWEYSDKPVADGQAVRSWIWGPEPFTPGIIEEYAEGSLADGTTGQRLVQYQDKSRMEITNPDADKNSIWYVTNGLLATELTSGQMQVGNNSFVSRSTAMVNVVGDADDANGITYQSMGMVLDEPPHATGILLNQRLNRAGIVSTDAALDAQSIRVGQVDEITSHGIAEPFWEFMNATGTVYQDGQFVQGDLFENPYFATGRPITEAYWQDALVGGTSKLVLTQCFERRCLTYTPDNAPEWQVEMGNIGLHYHRWRYDAIEPAPTATATMTPPATATATVTATATMVPATNYVFDSQFGGEIENDVLHQAPQDVAIDADGNFYLVDVNDNLVHKYDATGTWQMSWGGFGTQNGQFSSPTSITVDPSGGLYVADSGNNRVQKFDPDGEWQLNFIPPVFGFNSPTGIEASSDGFIYVSDSLNQSVYKYDTIGQFVLRVGSADPGSDDGEFTLPGHVTVSPDNNTVYVVDAGNHRIQAFDSSGAYLYQWGSQGSGDGQFESPEGIGVSPDSETVYVTDAAHQNIQVFDAAGGFLRQWALEDIDSASPSIPLGVALLSKDTMYVVDAGIAGIQVVATSDGSFIELLAENTRGRLATPIGIATLPNGDFVVIDHAPNQVKIFDAAGNFLRQWGHIEHLPNSLNLPFDVAVDSAGMIYVTEIGRDRITKFDSHGVFQTAWGENGLASGQFEFPQGIDVDADDNVYIADSGNDRIQKFTSSGVFISAWGTRGDGPGQFKGPIGIAVHGGEVHVVDAGNRRVQVFDLNGVYHLEFGSEGDGDDQFDLPRFVDVDTQGFIYVTDSSLDRVQKFRPDGTYFAQFGVEGAADGELDSPWGIVTLPNGDVAVADLDNHRVQIFRPLSPE